MQNLKVKAPKGLKSHIFSEVSSSSKFLLSKIQITVLTATVLSGSIVSYLLLSNETEINNSESLHNINKVYSSKAKEEDTSIKEPVKVFKETRSTNEVTNTEENTPTIPTNKKTGNTSTNIMETSKTDNDISNPTVTELGTIEILDSLLPTPLEEHETGISQVEKEDKTQENRSLIDSIIQKEDTSRKIEENSGFNINQDRNRDSLTRDIFE